MKCFCSEIEVRPRDGKVPFLICKWVGIDGDANASKFVVDPKTGKTRINLAAAKARQITLNKSIFPLTKEDLIDWLKGIDCQVLVKPDKETGELVRKEYERTLQECTELNLLYKSVPLSELNCDFKAISYYTAAGVLKTQNYVTVIGFADENDNWAETLTPIEMAQNNLNTNLANGTYFEAEEVEEAEPKAKVEKAKETKEEAKKKEEPKSDDDFDF